MSKFEQVLSDVEIFELAALGNPLLNADSEGDFYLSGTGESVPYDDLIALLRNVEQATITKCKAGLTEQEPVAIVDYFDGVVGLKKLIDTLPKGMKLYAHPMPSVSNTSDKTACVSEIEESETQHHLEYIKRYQNWRRGEDKTMTEAGINPKQLGESLDWLIAFAENHIPDSSKTMHLSVSIDAKEVEAIAQAYLDNLEGWKLVPKEPTMDMIKALLETIVTTSKGGVVNPKTTLTYALASAPKYTGENT